MSNLSDGPGDAVLADRVRNATHDVVTSMRERPRRTSADSDRGSSLEAAVVDYAVHCRAIGLLPEAMLVAVKAAAIDGVSGCRDLGYQQQLVHQIVGWAVGAYYRDE